MRFVGVDFGRKRVGLAVSDESATLARPWKAVPAGSSLKEAARRVVRALADLTELGDDGPRVEGIVVGLPRRLNGDDNEQTKSARAFATTLAAEAGLVVALQDERLTSHEAEARLALTQSDWRKRKPLLDAAAAAIILQDYLDGRQRERPLPAPPDAGEFAC